MKQQEQSNAKIVGQEYYTVSQLGAFGFCAGAFSTAILAVSLISYRRGVSQLVKEGLTEADAQKAIPYATQALGIATACVAGVGLAGAAVFQISGMDMKESVKVSTAKDAWGQVQAQAVGAALKRRLSVLGEHVGAILPRTESRQSGSEEMQPEITNKTSD